MFCFYKLGQEPFTIPWASAGKQFALSLLRSQGSPVSIGFLVSPSGLRNVNSFIDRYLAFKLYQSSQIRLVFEKMYVLPIFLPQPVNIFYIDTSVISATFCNSVLPFSKVLPSFTHQYSHAPKCISKDVYNQQLSCLMGLDTFTL